LAFGWFPRSALSNAVGGFCALEGHESVAGGIAPGMQVAETTDPARVAETLRLPMVTQARLGLRPLQGRYAAGHSSGGVAP